MHNPTPALWVSGCNDKREHHLGDACGGWLSLRSCISSMDQSASKFAQKTSSSHLNEADMGTAESHLLGIKGGGKFKMKQGETISSAC